MKAKEKIPDTVFIMAAQLPNYKKVPMPVSKYHYKKYATRYFVTKSECQSHCDQLNKLENL